MYNGAHRERVKWSEPHPRNNLVHHVQSIQSVLVYIKKCIFYSKLLLLTPPLKKNPVGVIVCVRHITTNICNAKIKIKFTKL